MVMLASPLRPSELVTLQVYVPNCSSPNPDSSRVRSVSVRVVVTPVVLVRVHTTEKSPEGLLLVTEQVRMVDSFTGSLVLVADTLTSGGSGGHKQTNTDEHKHSKSESNERCSRCFSYRKHLN